MVPRMRCRRHPSFMIYYYFICHPTFPDESNQTFIRHDDTVLLPGRMHPEHKYDCSLVPRRRLSDSRWCVDVVPLVARKQPKDMDFDGLFIVMVVLRNCQTPMGSLRAGTRVNNVKKRSYAYCSRSQHDNISSTYTKYTVVCALCSLPGRILSHAQVGVRLHPCGWICEVNHPLNRHCSHHSQHNLCMGDLVCTDRNISETPPYSNMWHQCHQLKHCGISVQGFEYQYCLLYALISNCCVPCEV